MISEFGRELLFTKITRPHTARMVNFSPGLFKIIPKGLLLVCDNNLLEQLQLTVTRAVEDGSFHRCGVVLIVDEETLNSEELLRSLNMRMRLLWASTTVLIKPWNGGLPRGRDGHFFTDAVGDIAARIDQALKRLPGLFKNPAIKLLCMHKSGRMIHNGPKAPLSPSMSLMALREGHERVANGSGRHGPLEPDDHPAEEGEAAQQPAEADQFTRQGRLQREEARARRFPRRIQRPWRTRWLQRIQPRPDDRPEWDTLPHLVVYPDSPSMLMSPQIF